MSIDWKSVVNVIGTVAPGIATMLGGPLAGTVVGELSQLVLGHKNGTQEEVAAAIGVNPSPDTLLKIKQLETDLKTKFIDAGIEWAKIAGEDVKDARAMQIQTRSKMPAYLGVLAIVTFFGMMGSMWFFGLPKDSQLTGILIMAFGMMRDEVKAIYNFVFGNTQGSDDNNKLLSKALDR